VGLQTWRHTYSAQANPPWHSVLAQQVPVTQVFCPVAPQQRLPTPHSLSAVQKVQLWVCGSQIFPSLQSEVPQQAPATHFESQHFSPAAWQGTLTSQPAVQVPARQMAWIPPLLHGVSSWQAQPMPTHPKSGATTSG
jgi:hypothetical protein